MDMTLLLNQWQQGDQAAFKNLIERIYDELKKVSRCILRQYRKGEERDATLGTTALLHAAYPRLADRQSPTEFQFRHPAQFFALARKVMLYVLLDYEKTAKRHGGRGESFASGPKATAVSSPQPEDLMALDEALAYLKKVHERTHKVITLYFLEEMPVAEIARKLDVQKSTIYKDRTAGLGLLRHFLNERTS